MLMYYSKWNTREYVMSSVGGCLDPSAVWGLDCWFNVVSDECSDQWQGSCLPVLLLLPLLPDMLSLLQPQKGITGLQHF